MPTTPGDSAGPWADPRPGTQNSNGDLRRMSQSVPGNHPGATPSLLSLKLRDGQGIFC